VAVAPRTGENLLQILQSNVRRPTSM